MPADDRMFDVLFKAPSEKRFKRIARSLARRTRTNVVVQPYGILPVVLLRCRNELDEILIEGLLESIRAEGFRICRECSVIDERTGSRFWVVAVQTLNLSGVKSVVSEATENASWLTPKAVRESSRDCRADYLDHNEMEMAS